MPREIITINIGGCGVNIGKSSLQQIATEQGISPSGYKTNATPLDHTISTLFEETSDGKHISRTLFTDLDPYSIETVRSRYKYSDLLYFDYLLSGNEDAGYNFAKGHYTKGKELIDSVTFALRTIIEACDNAQGFIINQSFSGGTGAGFGVLILERIAVDFRKKFKVGFQVFPNENRLSSSMEAYNSLFALHWFLDHTEISTVIDNKAMDTTVKAPTYSLFNNIITKLISNTTADIRMHSVCPGLVPFPRLHFMVPSISPLCTINDDEKKEDDDNIDNLVSECANKSNFLVDFPDYNVLRDKYMALDLYFRGKNIQKCVVQANEAMKNLNERMEISWVPWVANKATMKFTKEAAVALPNDLVKTYDKQVTMLANNSRIGRFFSNRIANKTDQLFANKCFVHHYTDQGMEMGEFEEAREDLGFLQMDYNDILQMNYDDDDDYDED